MQKNMIKNSLSLKIFIIGFLALLLMIPTGMIAVLVNDRQNRQEDAVREVSSKWGSEQTITGPVLSIPYKKNIESLVNGTKEITTQIYYAHFLPKSLVITGDVEPETRKRGIYEVVVYNSKLNLTGEFTNPDFSKWEINLADILYDKAFVSIGVPDMRGVKENINLTWGETDLILTPGIETTDVLSSGASVVVPNLSQVKDSVSFALNLNLNGSRDLMFVPLGKTTEVKLSSSWPSPSFQGAFLPTDHELSDEGFKANWKVLELNRNFPQSFLGTAKFESNAPVIYNSYEKYPAAMDNNFGGSNFGVRLLIPADEYQNTVRALKYAILTIALTFLVLFFFEAKKRQMVHPLQYILIGFALSLFYVLLLSLAEYIGFNYAYLISTLATVGLIKLYSKSIFKAWLPAIIEASILTFIYVFIYVILQLEDLSLLVGSIGLFLILAVIMYTSRKIDWYNFNEEDK